VSTRAATRSRLSRWVVRLLPVAIALSGLLLTLSLADRLVQREQDQLRTRAAAEAKHVAAQLRVGLLQALDPLQRIASWWQLQGRPLTPEDWDTDAQLFVRARAGLKQVTWIGLRTDRVWVLRPGQTARSEAFESPDPELKKAVEASRRLGSIAISDVFVAGGASQIYGCNPVKRQGKVVAFIAGLYDVRELMAAALEGQPPGDYSVVVTANGHEIPAIASSSARVWPGGAREAQMAISNSFWMVRVVPSEGEVETLRDSVVGFGVLVSVLLYACAAMALVARRRASELASANQHLVADNVERQRAEEKIGELNRDLQRRLQEFQVLLNVLPVGIAVADDPECRKIWMNRTMAAMLQVPMGINISKSEEVPSRPNYRLQQNGSDVPAPELPMQVAARTGTPVENHELDIVREDGTAINTLSYSAPLFDEGGAVRGVINACVDITERKRTDEERRAFLVRQGELEQRLVRAEKYSSLALMAGGIAHDFNNLLTVIIGQASLLAFEMDAQSAAAMKLRELMSAANRAAELTSRLLAFTGEIWCNTEAVDLSVQLSEVQGKLREMTPPTIELELDLAPALPLIRAGIPELRQVIYHLVENAVEALGNQAGKIEIRTSHCELTAERIESLFPYQQLTPGSYVRLDVIDNGCGIPEEIATRVFDPFFSTKFVGRGLGLSAVQGIVRAHGGGVWLDSLPTRGTRVEVFLPVDPARTAEDTKAAPTLA
jgi:signal transduction histidine kinase/sensor domain CHASE-containing protein